MAEKEKSRLRRLISRLSGMILALIAAAVIYLALVMLQTLGVANKAEPGTPEKQPAITRMQAATMNDVRELARMYEARLPVLSGYKLSGRGENATHDGGVARVVRLYYNGVTISAVRPASAAPLLLHGELDITLRTDRTVLNLPAVLACRNGAYCLYFSDETSAYTLYAPQAEEEEFLSLASRLSWVAP